MVNVIEQSLKDYTTYNELNIISDGVCDNNGNLYPDFDKFIANLFTSKIFNGDTLASCDTLLIAKNKNHIIFVEFKDMNSLNSEKDIKNWWKNKFRSIYLKITDSILSLSYLLALKKYSQNHDDFMNLSKSFFYVYKSDSYKNKIKNHLKYKFSRYSFLFENIRIVETKSFEKFLVSNGL